MRSPSILLFIVVLTSSLVVDAQCIDAGKTYTCSFQGHRYVVVQQRKTWKDAAACAFSDGGYLAEMNSDSEQILLNFYLQNEILPDVSKTIAADGGGASYLWLGGTDQKTEGDWEWNGDGDTSGYLFYRGQYPTGSPQNNAYLNWGNEPDDFGGKQDGLGLALTNWPLGFAGQWNDLNPEDSLFFVIEYNTETGLTDPKSAVWEFFPNPTRDKLFIYSPRYTETITVTVHNSNGMLLRRSALHWPFEMNVSDLARGYYWVTLLTDGITAVKPLVIAR